MFFVELFCKAAFTLRETKQNLKDIERVCTVLTVQAPAFGIAWLGIRSLVFRANRSFFVSERAIRSFVKSDGSHSLSVAL